MVRIEYIDCFQKICRSSSCGSTVPLQTTSKNQHDVFQFHIHKYFARLHNPKFFIQNLLAQFLNQLICEILIHIAKDSNNCLNNFVDCFLVFDKWYTSFKA